MGEGKRQETRAHPDLLLIGGANWQPQIDITISSCNRAILRLRVHANTVFRDAQEGGDTGVGSVVGVAGFD